jgi:hypothetical protein
VTRRSDFQRIAWDGRPAMRCRAQAHDVGRKPDRPRIAVESLVVQRDADAHRKSYRGNGRSRAQSFTDPVKTVRPEIIQKRIAGLDETPFQVFYGMYSRGSQLGGTATLYSEPLRRARCAVLWAVREQPRSQGRAPWRRAKEPIPSNPRSHGKTAHTHPDQPGLNI